MKSSQVAANQHSDQSEIGNAICAILAKFCKQYDISVAAHGYVSRLHVNPACRIIGSQAGSSATLAAQ